MKTKCRSNAISPSIGRECNKRELTTVLTLNLLKIMTNLEFRELAVQLCEATKQAIIKESIDAIPVDFDEFVYDFNIKQLEDLQLFGKDVDEALTNFNNETETEDDFDTLYNMIEYLTDYTLFNIFKTDEILDEFKEKIEKKLP